MLQINQLLTDIENKIDKIDKILSLKNVIKESIPTKLCKVEGCTFCNSNKSHYCKVCKNKDSNHYARNCPFKNKTLDEFIEYNAKIIKHINLDDFIDINGNIFITKGNILIILCYVYIISVMKIRKPPFESEKYNHFNFFYWVNNPQIQTNKEKLNCIYNYFNIMYNLSIQLPLKYEQILSQIITITKEKHSAVFIRRNMGVALSNLDITNIPIEQQSNCIQAVFANQNIGGGVLRKGCVQEEIRYVISPECLIAVLFFDKNPMTKNEVIRIKGTNIFSKFKGYGNNFKSNGPNDSINFDKTDTIVAFDATDYSNNSDKQYTYEQIDREIVKCMNAFEKLDINDNASFATGNWGCGVFNGNPQLKLIIQWIASSIVERNLTYNAYGDIRLSRIPSQLNLTDLNDVIKLIKSKYPNIMDLYTDCIKICKTDKKENLINELIK